VSSGAQRISGSSFTGCGGGLVVSGDAHVTLTAGNLADYAGYPTQSFAAVTDNATLTVGAGRLSTLGNAFALSGAASLDLEGVEVVSQDSARQAGSAIALLDGTPTVALSGSAIRNFSTGIHLGSSNPNLMIDNTTIADTHIGIGGLRTVAGSLRASITRSHFERLDVGFFLFPFTGPVDISVSNSEFHAISRPTLISIGGSLSLTDVTVSDCHFAVAVSARDNAEPLRATFRRVSVIRSTAGGFSLHGVASTIFDLGTTLSPGGNSVRDSSGGISLLFYSHSPILISAIGNTWTPNTQGTDANGQCSVVGEAQTFDLASANGPNFASQDDNQAILRLAEKSP